MHSFQVSSRAEIRIILFIFWDIRIVLSNF